MKKILWLLIAMFVMIPIVSEAYTPAKPVMITQTSCNQQVNVWKIKYNNSLKIMTLFVKLSYNSLDYVDCLWWGMRWEYEFTECNTLYERYKDSWNLLYSYGFLNTDIYDYSE